MCALVPIIRELTHLHFCFKKKDQQTQQSGMKNTQRDKDAESNKFREGEIPGVLLSEGHNCYQGTFFGNWTLGTQKGKHLCGGTKSSGSTLSGYDLEKKNVALTKRWDGKNAGRCCGFLREEQWRSWNKVWEREGQVTGLGYSKIKGRTQHRCYISQLLHRCAK